MTLMNARPLRVLVVEDNPDDAAVLAEALAAIPGSGFALTHVERLGQAVDALSREAFDLLLLDLTLPDASGLETLRNVRKAAPELPIVVLSGHWDEDLAVRALRESAQDYLVKGQVNAAALTRAMRYASERQFAQVALRRSEALSRALLQALPDALFRLGRSGSVLDARPDRERSLPAALMLSAGASIYTGWPEPLPSLTEGALSAVLRDGAPESFEYVHEDAGGRRVFEIRMVPAGMDEVVAVLRDMTARHELERERLERSRLSAIMETAVAVNHEINNALLPIIGWTELLLAKECPPDQGWRDDLENILEASLKIAETVRKLGSVVRPVTKSYTAHTCMLDIDASASDEPSRPA